MAVGGDRTLGIGRLGLLDARLNGQAGMSWVTAPRHVPNLFRRVMSLCTQQAPITQAADHK